MSTGSYEVFDQVARSGSFAAASDAMNLTPSAVSHAMASLEEELGFRLFIRKRSGVVLTKEGERMLLLVREILRAQQRLQEEADLVRGLEKGTVSIGTFSSILMAHFPEILGRFHERYPGIEITVLQGDYADVESWLRHGETQLGFTTLSEGMDSSFDFCELMQDPLRCVTARDYVPINGKWMTPQEIASQELILRRPGYNADAEEYIRSYLRGKSAHYYLDDDRSIFALVQAGMGVSLLPELTLSHIGFAVAVWPIRPRQQRRIGLIWSRTGALSPAAHTAKEFIIRYFRENEKN